MKAVAAQGNWRELTDAEWSQGLAIVFRETSLWNDDPAAWRWELLKRFQSLKRRHDPAPYCEYHRHPVKVRFEFVSPGDVPDGLYLAGNWNDAGSLADLSGWTYRPMRPSVDSARPGLWTADIELQRTPFNHLTHAVVRTAPWPRGRAVGTVVCRIGETGAQTVRMIPLPASAPTPAKRPPSGPKMPLAVFVVDGGSWHTFLPLVHEGRMPNLSRLLEEGSAARLVSVGGKTAFLSRTCLGTAFTGRLAPPRRPTRAFGFESLTGPPRLWEILSSQGKSVSTVGLRGTFPVDRGRGQRISEAYFFTRGLNDPVVEKMFLHPKITQYSAMFGMPVRDLARLKSLGHWVSRYMDTVWPTTLQNTLDDALPLYPLVSSSTLVDFARNVFDRPIRDTTRWLLGNRVQDALIAYVVGIDAASHAGWLGFEPPLLSEGAFSKFPRIKELFDRRRVDWAKMFYRSYADFDELLGEAMPRVETVVVFSDHGFTAVPLNNKVYSTSHFDPDRALSRYAAYRGDAIPESLSYDATPSGVKFSAEDCDAWLIGFRDFLASVRYHADNSAVFSIHSPVPKRRKKDGIPHFLVTNREADLLAHLGEPLTSAAGSLSPWDLFEFSVLSGDHAPNGMFAGRGPAFRSGLRSTEDAFLADVTPTLLAVLGVSIPGKLDGRILSELLVEGTGGTGSALRPRIVRATPLYSIFRSLRFREWFMSRKRPA